MTLTETGVRSQKQDKCVLTGQMGCNIAALTPQGLCTDVGGKSFLEAIISSVRR